MLPMFWCTWNPSLRTISPLRIYNTGISRTLTMSDLEELTQDGKAVALALLWMELASEYIVPFYHRGEFDAVFRHCRDVHWIGGIAEIAVDEVEGMGACRIFPQS